MASGLLYDHVYCIHSTKKKFKLDIMQNICALALSNSPRLEWSHREKRSRSTRSPRFPGCYVYEGENRRFRFFPLNIELSHHLLWLSPDTAYRPNYILQKTRTRPTHQLDSDSPCRTSRAYFRPWQCLSHLYSPSYVSSQGRRKASSKMWTSWQ